MEKSKILVSVTVMALFILGMISSASAIPVDITLSTPHDLAGEETSVPSIEAIIFPYMGSSASEVYRATPSLADQYAFSGSYDTSFSADTENVTISYVGSPAPIIVPTPANHVYLLAKDGKVPDDLPETHAWYLYDLTLLGWTGTEEITITGLWPEEGSFSHLSIYNTLSTSVPEPAIMFLLGFGLLTLWGATRKLKN